MPRLNALHNRICRDCGNLEYWDGYFCRYEEIPKEIYGSLVIQGMYIPVNKDLKECAYFVPRETCIPNDETKECQFWCSDDHGNEKVCPLYESRLKNI